MCCQLTTGASIHQLQATKLHPPNHNFANPTSTLREFPFQQNYFNSLINANSFSSWSERKKTHKLIANEHSFNFSDVSFHTSWHYFSHLSHRCSLQSSCFSSSINRIIYTNDFFPGLHSYFKHKQTTINEMMMVDHISARNERQHTNFRSPFEWKSEWTIFK